VSEGPSSRARGSRIVLSGHTLTGGAVDCRTNSRCSVEGPGEIVGAAVGVWAGKRARLSNVTVRDGEYGAFAVGKVMLENVAATGNVDYGVVAYGGIKAAHVLANDNGLGLAASLKALAGEDITASNNLGNGVDGGALHIRGLVAQGNGGIGAGAVRGISLRDAVVTGNGIDVQSGKAPKLRNTTCETSFNSTIGGSWGVCTND
jgi:hypothetical protein